MAPLSASRKNLSGPHNALAVVITSGFISIPAGELNPNVYIFGKTVYQPKALGQGRSALQFKPQPKFLQPVKGNS